MVTVPIAQPDPKIRSKKHRDKTPPASPHAQPAAGVPGMRIEGADGSISYAPFGYASTSSTRSSPSRPRSSSSLQYSTRQNVPVSYQAYNSGMRHISEGTRPTSSGANRRPLPDEQSWLPGSRRSSASSQSFVPDSFEYQNDNGAPIFLPGHLAESSAPARRHPSGPADVLYSPVRYPNPTGGSASASSRSHYVYPYGAPPVASSSEPILSNRRMRDGTEVRDDSSSDASSEDSDNLNHGVRVEPEVEKVVAPPPKRKPIGGGSSKKKGKR